jgi:hypothetical protein
MVFWNGIEQTRRGKGWGITPLLILGFLIGKPQATLALQGRQLRLGAHGARRQMVVKALAFDPLDSQRSLLLAFDPLYLFKPPISLFFFSR